MKTATIWHNPRCTKSRQTLALLEEFPDGELEIHIVKYLDEGPTLEELKSVLKKLDLKPVELVRNKEALFNELSLKGDEDDMLLQAMVEHPKLIERPIVILGGAAIIGRPPENVHKLFNG